MIANTDKIQDFKGSIKPQIAQNALIMPQNIEIMHSVEYSL